MFRVIASRLLKDIVNSDRRTATELDDCDSLIRTSGNPLYGPVRFSFIVHLVYISWCPNCPSRIDHLNGLNQSGRFLTF